MQDGASLRLFVVFAVFFALVSIAAPTLGQSLDEMRVSGALGERFDGFAQALEPSAQPEVEKINAKRKTIYQTRASEEGVSADQIGRVYAAQIFKKAPSGTRFLQEDGKWITK